VRFGGIEKESNNKREKEKERKLNHSITPSNGRPMNAKQRETKKKRICVVMIFFCHDYSFFFYFFVIQS
jgi:hypothetical protein